MYRMVVKHRSSGFRHIPSLALGPRTGYLTSQSFCFFIYNMRISKILHSPIVSVDVKPVGIMPGTEVIRICTLFLFLTSLVEGLILRHTAFHHLTRHSVGFPLLPLSLCLSAWLNRVAVP